MESSSGRDWLVGKEEDSRGEGQVVIGADAVVLALAREELEVLQRAG